MSLNSYLGNVVEISISIITFSLCLKFPLGEFLECKVTRNQLSLYPQHPCVHPVISFAPTTILSQFQFSWTIKSLSPYNIINKLCRSSFFIPIMGCKLAMCLYTKSLSVCNLFLLICIFWGLIFWWFIL